MERSAMERASAAPFQFLGASRVWAAGTRGFFGYFFWRCKKSNIAGGAGHKENWGKRKQRTLEDIDWMPD